MQRRTFIQTSLAAAIGLPFSGWALENYKDVIIGHNSHQYTIDVNWGALNSNFYPVTDCHEMVQDSKGRIVMLTNNTKNNILIYDKSGKLLETWGSQYPGAHGLTLHIENGEDYLFIADNNRHEVIKTTIDGKVVLTIPYPKMEGKYKTKDQFIPTETAIAPNGDIYIADGYGAQFISHFNAKGELLNIFGGRGEGDDYFDNAHGICLDDRDPKNPTLLITARQRNQLKRFSLSGKLIEVIDLPGAYICRPVIHGENVYLAVLISKLPWDSQTGFICILDKNNKVVSVPGGSQPIYKNEKLERLHQTVKVFQHPHDVCIDDDNNIYVAQWNSGKTYPIKLIRQ
jgi:hypothetical protein